MAQTILLTGGSGRLGIELRRLCPEIVAPPHVEMDVTDLASVQTALQRYGPDLVVHAAAFTDVANAEHQRDLCWRVNVVGTRNMVQAATRQGVRLIHISTDYVFEGTRGQYHEEDVLGPVQTYYGLTKLVAEELTRLHPRHLIIRTSFRPREWPYPIAFTDLLTSQDYVDVVAPQIAQAVHLVQRIPYDTIHIATERKSTFDLAKRRRPDVLPGSKRDAGVTLPDDISLDISRWQRFRSQFTTSGQEVLP